MTRQRFKLDTQAYITLAYLITVAVGMMFDYKYYREFSINIFEYADILDFLLTPVKNLEVIGFVAASAFAVFIFYRFDKLWGRKWPKSYKFFNLGISGDRMQRVRPVLMAILSVAYLSIASDFYSERKFNDFQESTEKIEIVYEGGGLIVSGKLIGKNSDYVFLQTSDKAIKAIPVASDVQEIVIKRP